MCKYHCLSVNIFLEHFYVYIKGKTNTAKLSELLQNIISKSLKEAKSIPLTHKYMAWYMYFNKTKHPLLVIHTNRCES